MDYPFPTISGACPICSRGCEAVYRGYYRRWAICPEAPWIGWVAIRTGYCKATRRRFALFPEFLITFRSFSRQALLWLYLCWSGTPDRLIQSVDAWFGEFHREVYLSLFTLYSQLRFLISQIRSGSQLFGIKASSFTTLYALRDLSPEKVESIILHPCFGLAANLRIDPPP
jgi:hypothetical protein